MTGGQTTLPAGHELEGVLTKPLEFIRCPTDENGKSRLFGQLSPLVPLSTWYARNRLILADGRAVLVLTEVRAENVPASVLAESERDTNRQIFSAPIAS